MPRSWLNVAFLAFLAACATERPISGAIDLSRKPVVLTPDPPLAAPGPRTFLCVTLRDRDSFSRALNGQFVYAVKTTGGELVAVSATFLGTDGGSVGPVPVSFLQEGAGGKQVCIEPHSLPNTVVRVELVADGKLSVKRVTWWSGKPRLWF